MLSNSVDGRRVVTFRAPTGVLRLSISSSAPLSDRHRAQRRQEGIDLAHRPGTARTLPIHLAAGQPGFSLHAATVREAAQRDKLEKLCRHIARPAIADERLSTNDRGQVIYRFKQPFRDGSTHVVLEPLDFIARPAALVPRPRLNLTRFHGVFAPNRKHRESVVPKRKPRHEKPDKPLAPMTRMRRPKCVFAIDIETCPKCGGKLRVIARIENPDVIATILEHVRAREAAITANPRAPPLNTEIPAARIPGRLP